MTSSARDTSGWVSRHATALRCLVPFIPAVILGPILASDWQPKELLTGVSLDDPIVGSVTPRSHEFTITYLTTGPTLSKVSAGCSSGYGPFGCLSFVDDGIPGIIELQIPSEVVKEELGGKIRKVYSSYAQFGFYRVTNNVPNYETIRFEVPSGKKTIVVEGTDWSNFWPLGNFLWTSIFLVFVIWTGFLIALVTMVWVAQTVRQKLKH